MREMIKRVVPDDFVILHSVPSLGILHRIEAREEGEEGA